MSHGEGKLSHEVIKVRERLGDPTARYVRVGKCDHCDTNSITFSCKLQGSKAACASKYCANCLTSCYNEDIMQILSSQYQWQCPSHRGICYCRKCRKTQGHHNLHAVLQRRLTGLVDGFFETEEKAASIPNPASTVSQAISHSDIKAKGKVAEPLTSLAESKNQTANEVAEPQQTLGQVRLLYTPPQNADKIGQNLTGESKGQDIHQYKVQAALEYNAHVLRSLVELHRGRSNQEAGGTLRVLWNNLRVLARDADVAAEQGAVKNDLTLLQLRQHPSFLSLLSAKLSPVVLPVVVHKSTGYSLKVQPFPNVEVVSPARHDAGSSNDLLDRNVGLTANPALGTHECGKAKEKAHFPPAVQRQCLKAERSLESTREGRKAVPNTSASSVMRIPIATFDTLRTARKPELVRIISKPDILASPKRPDENAIVLPSHGPTLTTEKEVSVAASMRQAPEVREVEKSRALSAKLAEIEPPGVSTKAEAVTTRRKHKKRHSKEKQEPVCVKDLTIVINKRALTS